MKRVEKLAAWLTRHPPWISGRPDHIQAAVALVLMELPGGLQVLFIERAPYDGDCWSGDIALPGGRREACDPSLRHTAERETREELGLDLSAARYVGRLGDIAVRSLNIVVACYVYAV